MKKTILLIAMLSAFASYAQETDTITASTSIFDRKHEVKVGAVKLLAGPIFEGTYEYIQTKDFTFGASILYNFVDDSDYYEKFSITPFARFYFQESKEYGAKGFFVEGFGKYVTGNNYDVYVSWDGVDERHHKFSSGALGLALGKKWINRTGFVFEILAGAGRTIEGSENAPDAIFRGDLNIGYRF